MDLDAIIDLFENKHTAQLSDRHTQSIILMCAAQTDELKKGFYFKDLHKVAQVVALILSGLQRAKVSPPALMWQFDLIEGVCSLLTTLREPFAKEKASDESKEVPKLVAMLNSLCDLLNYEVPVDEDPDGSITTEWENARMEIANTLTAIANFEAADQLEQEPTEEDKIIHGAANASPMLRLFANGTKNLKAISVSRVPGTVVALLGEESSSKTSVDTMISLLETLTAISVYQPITKTVIQLDAGRTLVRIINQQNDFRSYVVSLAIEALWNLIEVGGKEAI